MKKFLFLLVIIALIMFSFSCGKKGSDETTDEDGDEIEMIDEDADAEDADADADDKADDEEEAEDEADEEESKKVTKADSVENLFTMLDQAIKSGDISKARSLYDPTSQEKVKTADPALASTTVDGQILFEIENRANYKNQETQVSGSGENVSVTFPSGKEISGVSVKKVGDEYKIDVLNSPDGDLLDL